VVLWPHASLRASDQCRAAGGSVHILGVSAFEQDGKALKQGPHSQGQAGSEQGSADPNEMLALVRGSYV
jgi:hypothetical protein